MSGFGNYVAPKGRTINEHHNHDDVGQYLVVMGERAVLLDPGGEVWIHSYNGALVEAYIDELQIEGR